VARCLHGDNPYDVVIVELQDDREQYGTQKRNNKATLMGKKCGRKDCIIALLCRPYLYDISRAYTIKR